MNADGEYARFVVIGTPCSANRVTRRVGNRSVKSAESRRYQALVAEAARECGAVATPLPCAVTLDLYNVRLDIDNAPKAVLDGAAGIVYANDKQIRKLTIEHHRDRADKTQRVRVVVTPYASEEIPPCRTSSRPKPTTARPRTRAIGTRSSSPRP